MTRQLLLSLTLFALLPLTSDAQVLAGHPTGLAHTTVGILLVPAMEPFPMSTEDTASIDLQGDGSHEFLFSSGNIHAFDADGSYNHCTMLHEGVEVAMTVPGGFEAQRLHLMDPVDASLNWHAYSDFGINSASLASLLTNFAGQWDTAGVGQWFFSATAPTQGYLGVRTVQDDDTLYGWVNLTSFVSQDSAWLQIEDFAIEIGTTAISDAQGSNGISTMLTANGALLVQGDTGELLRITLRDPSGRVLHDGAAPAPYLLDIADEAHGVYLLTVKGRSNSRSFKLAW